MAKGRPINWSFHGQEICNLYTSGLSPRDIVNAIWEKHGIKYPRASLQAYLARTVAGYRDRVEGLKACKARRTKLCRACQQDFMPTNFHHIWCDECTGAGKYKRRLRAYGLTGRQLEAMLAEQGNACKICRTVFPDGFSSDRRRTLYVDHDHTRNVVRGLVCPRCNLGLSFVDQPGWIDRAFAYVNDREFQVRFNCLPSQA